MNSIEIFVSFLVAYLLCALFTFTILKSFDGGFEMKNLHIVYKSTQFTTSIYLDVFLKIGLFPLYSVLIFIEWLKK